MDRSVQPLLKVIKTRDIIRTLINEEKIKEDFVNKDNLPLTVFAFTKENKRNCTDREATLSLDRPEYDGLRTPVLECIEHKP